MRTIRKRRGLSQEDISVRMKMSRRAYGNYENGKREIGILALKAFADVTTADPLDLKHSDNRTITAENHTEGPLPTPWPQHLRTWRTDIIAARVKFNQEKYQKISPQSKDIVEVIWVGCAIAVWLRTFAPDLLVGWLPQVEGPDLGLKLSCLGALGLWPFPVTYYVSFFRWNREKPASEQNC